MMNKPIFIVLHIVLNLSCPDSIPQVGGQCACLPRMVFNCSIIDLDPKSIEGLSNRLEVESEIAQNAFRKYPLLIDF